MSYVAPIAASVTALLPTIMKAVDKIYKKKARGKLCPDCRLIMDEHYRIYHRKTRTKKRKR